MKHIHWIRLQLTTIRERLANIDTSKVLTKIHLSKSIQVMCIDSVLTAVFDEANSYSPKLAVHQQS